jgi:hypothetical protein
MSSEKSGLPDQPPVWTPNVRRSWSTVASSLNIAFHTIATLTLPPMSDGP